MEECHVQRARESSTGSGERVVIDVHLRCLSRSRALEKVLLTGKLTLSINHLEQFAGS